MREIEPPFQIEESGVTIKVIEHSMHDERVFHVEFSDKRKSLILVVTEKRPSGEKFWTSVPQGRQAEAEDICRAFLRRSEVPASWDENAGK